MMQCMTMRHSWFLPVLAAAAVPIAGFGQETEIEAEALELLRGSTAYVAAMSQFKIETEATIEAVLPDGQKLQFDHHVKVAIQRPNKLRAERIGELVSQTFYYDGASLSMDLPETGYYATAAAPATLDEALDFARDELTIIAPGADLIYSDSWDRLTAGLTSAFIVGEVVIGGHKCTHLAFRNNAVDWQIWIQQGEKPLPRKLVVTSKLMPESPQFTVLVSKWEKAHGLKDADFEFKPPKDSHKIEFITAPTSAP